MYVAILLKDSTILLFERFAPSWDTLTSETLSASDWLWTREGLGPVAVGSADCGGEYLTLTRILLRNWLTVGIEGPCSASDCSVSEHSIPWKHSFMILTMVSCWA